VSFEDYQNDLKFTIGTCTGRDLVECVVEESEAEAAGNKGCWKYICNGCERGYVWLPYDCLRLKDYMIAYHAVETP